MNESHGIHIRLAVKRDAMSILSIEAASYNPPWTEEQLISRLRFHNCIGMIAEVNNEVVGFMVYELSKARLDLIRFAVHPGVRRQGVGTAMMDKLIGKLGYRRRHSVVVVVSETAIAAHRFLRSLGIKATRVHRAWFDEQLPVRDGYEFRYSVKEGIECQR